jgi:peroxiredoxin
MTLTRRSALALPALALFPAAAMAAPAPGFSLKDADGRTRTLAEFRGKVVVMEWINEGCPYVKKHYTGNMQALQKAAVADGVVWLSVCSSAPGQQGHVDGAGAKRFIADKGAAPTAFLLDPTGVAGKAWGAKTTPHMYIVDKAGQLVYQGGIDDKPTANVADIAGATNYVKAALADLKAGRPVKVAFSKPYGCAVKYA